MSLDDLIGLDSLNFYVVDFDEAKPRMVTTLLQYFGLFTIKPGGCPKTNGREIILPSCRADFVDEKKPLHLNRNVSLYIGSLCHELSHIIGGCFVIDFAKYLVNNFEQVKIAQTIHNIIRDRCDEDYFKRKYASRNDSRLMKNCTDYHVQRRQMPEDRANKFFEIYSTKTIAGKHKGELDEDFKQEIDEFLSQDITSEEIKKTGIKTLKDLLDKLVDISVFERETLDAGKESLQATTQVYEIIMEEFKDMPTSLVGYTVGGEHGEGEIEVGDMDDIDAKRGEIDAEFKRIKGKIKAQDKEEQEDKDKKQKETNDEPYFDHITKSYNNASKVYDEIIKDTNPNFLQKLRKYDSITEEVIGYLLELQPNKVQLVERTTEPDEINLEAVIEVIADPSLGHDARIFDSMRINKRDYAVGILVDCSGSTCEQINGDTILDIEKYLAGILFQGLSYIGDKVNMYAFESDYRESTDSRLYSIPNLEALGSLTPTNANRDGAVIRRMTKHLMNQEAKDRWMVIVADGRPNAHEYDGDMAREDTAKAIEEAEGQDIRVIYLNGDDERPDYFHRLTRHATYARWFNSVKQLPRFAYDLVTEVMV